jgi:hypothetical protein
MTLLTGMGEVPGSALDPNAFFEQVTDVLENKLGMVRMTLTGHIRVSMRDLITGPKSATSP